MIDLDFYKKTIKVRYQKQPQNLYELDRSHARKWMRTHFPKAKISEHLSLRNEAREKWLALGEQYSIIRDREFRAVFRRAYRPFADYVVESYCREEFSPKIKQQLTQLHEESDQYRCIDYAHGMMLPIKLRLPKGAI